MLHAGVWWFPPLVLQTAAFALSFCLGVLIYVISYYAWHSQENAQAVCPLLPASACQPCGLPHWVPHCLLLLWYSCPTLVNAALLVPARAESLCPGCLQQAVLLGGLSFFMAWVVQAFFAAVLLVRPCSHALL